MPNHVALDPTHGSIAMDDATALEGVDVTNFPSGTLAYVHTSNLIYVLNKDSFRPKFTTIVFYTKNSYNQPLVPGRWLLAFPVDAAILTAELNVPASTVSPRPAYEKLLSLTLPEGRHILRANVAATFLDILGTGFGNAFFRFTADSNPGVSLVHGEFAITSAAIAGPPFPPIPASGSGGAIFDSPVGGTVVNLEWAVNELLPGLTVSIVPAPNEGQSATFTATPIA